MNDGDKLTVVLADAERDLRVVTIAGFTEKKRTNSQKNLGLEQQQYNKMAKSWETINKSRVIVEYYINHLL